MEQPVSYLPIHSEYCRLVNLPLPYHEGAHASAWFLFLKMFDINDLREVVRYLRWRYKDKPSVLISVLRFRHLIVQRDSFMEYLAEAKSFKSLYKPKSEGVALSDRYKEKTQGKANPVRSAGIVAKDLVADKAARQRALDELKRFKAEMGWID